MDVLSIARVSTEIEHERTLWDKLKASIFPGVPEYFSQLMVLNAKIQALVQLEYKTTRVFVTFESVKDQRHALSILSVGAAYTAKNDPRMLPDKKYMFRGKYVLAVAEAEEPDTIHWRSLNVSFIQQLRQRAFTTLLTALCIYAVTLAIRAVNNISTAVTAMTISIFNGIFANVGRAITSIEQHSSDGSMQKSLYFKVSVFRFVNTVLVISLITPFTSFLAADHGLIPQVYSVFYAEIVVQSVLQFCDFSGHFKRHYLAPRAYNQDQMNLCFEGSQLDIAER
jgi:Calcium-activated chloride channel